MHLRLISQHMYHAHIHYTLHCINLSRVCRRTWGYVTARRTVRVYRTSSTLLLYMTMCTFPYKT